ncbi:hypothetical protein [uncultured Paenibacillus sp.]|uniref:hypothetical protein n=1 Tax=uncultured Paenibacillus sp. TaxID=227322 RepID=UPI0015AF1463|nr:hypothetical protein [uncultured Paenibacillus sp.]
MIQADRGKTYLFLGGGLIVLLAFALLVSRWFGQPPASASLGVAAQPQTQDEHAVVATVDGTPVTMKEFKARLPELRADIMTYYQQTYGCDPGNAHFWSEPCGGELPLVRLKEATLRLLVEDRVRELAANKAGLPVAVGYDAFLREWEAENRNRAERLAAGQVIYGPREYSESAYYRYVVSGTILGLKQWLAKHDGPPTEEQLRQEYADSLAGQPRPPAYETIRDALVQQWSEKRYESWFKAQLKQARVKVNRQVFERITL